MAVSDTGMTALNKIIDRCFKEIGLKQRDYNGRTHFGSQTYALRTAPLTSLIPSVIFSLFVIRNTSLPEILLLHA